MKKTFTIRREELADTASLMTDIIEATGSELEAESVLRSLERLGNDEGIEYYEVSQVPGRRVNGDAPRNAWRVRADRGLPVVAE